MSASRSLARRLLAGPLALLADRRGSTAIEYTIIAGLLSVAIVASLSQITTPLSAMLADVGARFSVK